MDISSPSSDIDSHSNHPDEFTNQSVEIISRGFYRQLDLECDDDSASKLLPDSEVPADDENEEEEIDADDDDADFTFMFVGGDDSSIHGGNVFEDGQIRPVFPLFDQNLLLDGDYEVEEIDRLPIQPPVDKIFIQSPRGFPSSSSKASENEENSDATVGPYCAWSKESATATAELSKKSNSTGFSKLWRLKDKGGRSNSYGRDAFVFFKSSDKKAAETATTSSSKLATADGTIVKVNVAGGKARVVKQGTKAKKSTISPHEAYLKSRGEHTEEERRRSYLPYRPELMGFFTNVHGGLTKNVHPY